MKRWQWAVCFGIYLGVCAACQEQMPKYKSYLPPVGRGHGVVAQAKVPVVEQVEPEKAIKETPQEVTKEGVEVAREEVLPQGCEVELNRASTKELETLPGIGPAIAGRIVAWRSRGKGRRFRKASQIQRVKGIGRATWQKLRGKVCVTK